MAYDFSKLVLNKAGKIVLNKGGCVVPFIQNNQIPKNSILVEYSTDANESYINARYGSYEKEKINSRTYLFKLSAQQVANGVSGFLSDSANTNPLRVTADLSDVKNAAGFCAHCTELVSVDIRNTQNIEIANSMFESNIKLEHIPNIVFGKNVKNIASMFKGCYNIKSGILEFYNAHKNLESLVSVAECFVFCGVDENFNYTSEQIKNERSSIPFNWGGDISEDFETVTIGDQVWMASNLNLDDGYTDHYSNDAHPEFGTYYSHTRANAIAKRLKGWHMPSDEEWNTLLNNVTTVNREGPIGPIYNDPIKIRSTTDWNDKNGTNEYNLTIYPAGRFNSNTNDFEYVGRMVDYFTNDMYGATYIFYTISDGAAGKGNGPLTNYIFRPYRLVKDV